MNKLNSQEKTIYEKLFSHQFGIVFSLNIGLNRDTLCPFRDKCIPEGKTKAYNVDIICFNVNY